MPFSWLVPVVRKVLWLDWIFLFYMKGGEIMAISKEIIDGILGFDPGRVVVEGQKIDLGRIQGVEDNIHAVYGNYFIRDRFVYDPNEPLLFTSRTRPSVALETRDKSGQVVAINTLFYATDIKALGEDLALKVLDHLTFVQEGIKAVA